MEKKLNVSKAADNKPAKLTYEQLEDVAKQLSDQVRNLVNRNQQLEKQLENVNIANVFTQLQFEFEIIKNKDIFPSDFVEETMDRIRKIMTPVKVENKEENKEEK